MTLLSNLTLLEVLMIGVGPNIGSMIIVLVGFGVSIGGPALILALLLNFVVTLFEVEPMVWYVALAVIYRSAFALSH